MMDMWADTVQLAAEQAAESESSKIDMGADNAGLATDSEWSMHLSDFTSWMAAEQKRIYLLCLRILRNSDEADTATQDVFLKAHANLIKGKAALLESPAAWLTRVAVNTSLDILRSRRWKFWQQRLPQDDEQALLLLSAAKGPNPEEVAYSRQIVGRLNLGVERLSLRQRAVFLLRHEEGKGLEEIAEILGLDIGTVKVHMSRAVAKLRQELRDIYAGKTLD